MTVRRFVVDVTTDGAQAATVFTPYLSGLVHAIHYIKTDFTDGVDFTITAEATGETIWTQADVNAAVVKAPRQATHSTAGVAALYVAAGTAVQDRIAISRDRIKIVIAQGGASKVGQFQFIIAD